MTGRTCLGAVLNLNNLIDHRYQRNFDPTHFYLHYTTLLFSDFSDFKSRSCVSLLLLDDNCSVKWMFTHSPWSSLAPSQHWFHQEVQQRHAYASCPVAPWLEHRPRSVDLRSGRGRQLPELADCLWKHLHAWRPPKPLRSSCASPSLPHPHPSDSWLLHHRSLDDEPSS